MLQVHQAAIDAGDKESGCTIHQVTETVDGGPIVVQKVVQVRKFELHVEKMNDMLITIKIILNS
jgi:folate-dependent phosphoribosylglycinamide formyltransferase PurN